MHIPTVFTNSFIPYSTFNNKIVNKEMLLKL